MGEGVGNGSGPRGLTQGRVANVGGGCFEQFTSRGSEVVGPGRGEEEQRARWRVEGGVRRWEEWRGVRRWFLRVTRGRACDDQFRVVVGRLLSCLGLAQGG